MSEEKQRLSVERLKALGFYEVERPYDGHPASVWMERPNGLPNGTRMNCAWVYADGSVEFEALTITSEEAQTLLSPTYTLEQVEALEKAVRAGVGDLKRGFEYRYMAEYMDDSFAGQLAYWVAVALMGKDTLHRLSQQKGG